MNAIEIKNLEKSYKEFKLDNINLTLPGGTIMGLIGENGAGKSTLIKLILDMISRDGGTITVLGRDNREEFNITKEDIGVAFDEPGFSYCLTAREVGNIMAHTYKNWDDEKYCGNLRKMGIPENKKFKEFSRGMKMKLQIAVALSHNARLLILDEATSGLDPVVRDEILDMFADFTRDDEHSILMSSHIVSDLEKICDYIAFLHKGQLLLCEEKDTLREEYAIINVTNEQMAKLDGSDIKGRRITPYGAQVLVKRGAAPAGADIGKVDIEELFVFMAKEDK